MKLAFTPLLLLALASASMAHGYDLTMAESIAAGRNASAQQEQVAKMQEMMDALAGYRTGGGEQAQMQVSRWVFGKGTVPVEMRMGDVAIAKNALASVRWRQDPHSLKSSSPRLGRANLPQFLITETEGGVIARRNDLKVSVRQIGSQVEYTVNSAPLTREPALRVELLKAWLPGSHDPYYQATFGDPAVATVRITPGCHGQTTLDGVKVVCGPATGAWGNKGVPAWPDQYKDTPMSAFPVALFKPGFQTGAALGQAGYIGKPFATYDLYGADDKLHPGQALQVMRVWQAEKDGTRTTLLTGVFHKIDRVAAWVKGFNEKGCEVIYAHDPLYHPQAYKFTAGLSQTFTGLPYYYRMMAAGGMHPGYTVAVQCSTK